MTEELFQHMKSQIQETAREFDLPEWESTMLHQLKKFYIACKSKEHERKTGNKGSKAMILRFAERFNFSEDMVRDTIYRPYSKQEPIKSKNRSQVEMEL